MIYIFIFYLSSTTVEIYNSSRLERYQSDDDESQFGTLERFFNEGETKVDPPCRVSLSVSEIRDVSTKYGPMRCKRVTEY